MRKRKGEESAPVVEVVVNESDEPAEESDVEGHFFLPNPDLTRAVMRDREREIQRDLQSRGHEAETRRPFRPKSR